MTFLEKINAAIPIAVYCRLINLQRQIDGRKQRIRPFGDEGIHIASDGQDEIYICRRARHWRYKRGVAQGIHNLARQYHLDQIPEVLPDGLFVDCGANVGELGIWARGRGLDYIAFEPEDLEATCSDLNNFGGEPETNRKALWYADTVLTFHSKPESADSSVFDIDGADGAVQVQAVPLDHVLKDREIGPGTRIFKLEAEGAEPEVLQGAAESLPLFDYIAVDCGYERGRDAKHTFVEVNRTLTHAGFEVIAAGFHRVTMLYQNINRLR